MMWWENLVAELLSGIVAVATVIGGVAGAVAGFWLGALTDSATVALIALVVGVYGGAKGMRLLARFAIDRLEQRARSF
jgi:hypothetical protein